MRRFGPLLAVLLLTLAPHVARAGADLSEVPATFERFCRSWMGKLQVREQRNVKAIDLYRYGEHFMGDYTGYSRRPARCVVRPTSDPRSPYIGQIVYDEIVYRVVGRTREQARSNAPQVLRRIKVTELFRFDGLRWSY